MRLPRLALPLLLAAALLIAPRLSAQDFDPMTGGRTYVVAFPDTTQNTYDERFKVRQIPDTLALFIYSPVATRVRITGNGYLNNVDVQAGTFAQVYLNSRSNKAAYPIVTQTNTESRNVFRLEADDPIVVYCYIATKFGGEAWTPLSVENWGMEYIAATREGDIIQDVSPGGETDYRARNKAASAEITVISAYDNTEVEIIPPDTSVHFVGYQGSPTIRFTLAADRAYQVQSLLDTLTAHYGDLQIDLTGVRVRASKPIGVMSGNTRSAPNSYASAGLARNSMKNMAMESLAPVEQHGTEFVFTPVMDDRRVTGAADEKVAEKRQGELVRINASEAVMLEMGGDTLTIPSDTVRSELMEGIATDRVRYIHTSGPAQMFAHPYAVVKNLTTTGGSGSYDMWGSFMVEMTPREQWVSFAPFFAPPGPDSLKHYYNLVTDTASRGKIIDNTGAPLTDWTLIPGTDLCWTSSPVSPGITRYFRATDPGVRFGAFLYGLRKGHEEYRPGRTKRKDDRRSVAHPSEYEEYIAISYAYPISPRRAILAPPDSLSVAINRGCDSAIVEVTALGADPVGLRDIELGAGSSNTRLDLLLPTKSADVLGRNLVRFKVVRLNSPLEANAEVVVHDRTGAEKTIRIVFPALHVTLPRTSINFGTLSGDDSRDQVVTIINTDSAAQQIASLTTNGNATIISPDPPPTPNAPITLAPGDTLKVTLRISASGRSDQRLYDSLVARFECASLRVPVTALIAQPQLSASDINFGTVVFDSSGSLTALLCNSGTGPLHLSGTGAIVWDDTASFSLSQSTLDSLTSGVTLAPGECFTITVLFRPSRGTGDYRTVAHFHFAGEHNADSSVWSAQVRSTSEVEWSRIAQRSPTLWPLPAMEKTEIRLALWGAGNARVVLRDERGTEVLRSEHTLAAGESRIPIDVRALREGFYYCTITVQGATKTMALVVVH